MSKKFRLVQDVDDDSQTSSVRRHLGVVTLVIGVPVIALVVLYIVSSTTSAGVTLMRERQQQVVAMTRTATPTRTPRPTNTPIAYVRLPVKANSAIRRAPSMDSPSTETARADRMVVLIGIDASAEWYKLDEGTWIHIDDILGHPPALPMVPR